MAQYGGGDGTAAQPYQIWSAEHFRMIGLRPGDWDKHFKLMADIDLSEIPREGLNAIGVFLTGDFSGVFEGNDREILNLAHDVSALFGRVNGPNAIIKNVVLKDVEMQGGKYVASLVNDLVEGTVSGCSVTGSLGGELTVGGLIAVVWAGGTVSDCHAKCLVGGKQRTGGLVGSSSGCIINCSSDSVVFGTRDTGALVGLNTGSILRSFGSGKVTGSTLCGGLVGDNHGQVYDCYARAEVHGTSGVGGLAGGNVLGGRIVRCYAAGILSEPYNAIGGLVGYHVHPDSYLADSLWDRQVSGTYYGAAKVLEGAPNPVNCHGYMTLDMHRSRFYLAKGWDFAGETANGVEDIWSIDEGKGYPYFAVQNKVYYVDAIYGDDNNDGLSASSAYASIYRAFRKAVSGDTIIVNEGLYQEDLDFAGRSINLRSWDPADISRTKSTIIQGSGSGSVVVFDGSETGECRLSGFTITGGHASLAGGGIRGNGTRAEISNCIIRGNVAENRGGGVHGLAGPLIACIVSENRADTGGGLAGCTASITNCLISSNVAEYCGGLNNCDGALVHCTIVDNFAVDGGVLNECDGTLTNCIIWGNSGDVLAGCNATITYSCFAGGSEDGNIDADPQFVNAGLKDWRLSAGSPCIDAGTDAGVFVDLCGDARPFDFPDVDNNGELPDFDMGAYERVNQIPVAYAGENVELYAGAGGIATVGLDGSGSYDADGDTLAYVWIWEIDGEVLACEGVNVVLELPRGEHVVSLVVSDGVDDSLPSEVAVKVLNAAPVANAGQDVVAYAWIDGTAEVMLDASASSDVNGDTLSYRWLLNGVEIATGINPCITLEVGSYAIELIVFDGWDTSEPCEVLIVITEAIKCIARIMPKTINLKSASRSILAIMELSDEVAGEGIDDWYGLVMEPGDVTARLWRLSNKGKMRQIFAFFDTQSVVDSLQSKGKIRVYVIGRLMSGQYFYGTDDVQVIGTGKAAEQRMPVQVDGRSAPLNKP